MGTGQEPNSAANIPRQRLAGRCCSVSLRSPQVLSMSWQKLLSLGFAVQSMSNNDGALPSLAAPPHNFQCVQWPNRTSSTAMGTGTASPGLPGHTADMVPGALCTPAQEGRWANGN